MEAVSRIEDILNIWLLGYVSYPALSKGSCFVYPQYAFTKSGIMRIPTDLLPSLGAIGVSFQGRKPGFTGSYDADWARKELGEVVGMRINRPEMPRNKYYESGENKCVYFGEFNPGFAAGTSEVELQRLAYVPGLRELYQVVRLEGRVDLTRAPATPVALVGGASIVTRRVAVEDTQGSKLAYLGPVEWQAADDGRVRLSAAESQGLYVTRVDASEAPETLVVRDIYGDGSAVATLIEDMPFTANRGQGERIDWVSDRDLIERAAQGIKAAKRLKGCTAGDFKSALEACRLEGIYATRKERIRGLVELPRYWDDLGDAVAQAMRRPEVAAYVVDLALSDRYLPAVREKLLDTSVFRREAAAAEEEAYREANARRAELKQAEAQLATAQAKVADLEGLYAQTKQRALTDAEVERAELEAELTRKRAELQRLQDNLERAEERKDEVRALMKGLLSDRDALAADILRDAVVHSAIEQAGRAEVAPEGPRIIDTGIAPDADADALSDEEIVGAVREAISDRAGRDLAPEEVVNLLVCLVQGPATVLSGMPGTGKTSLVRALAGSLGLVGGGRRRFVEVGVERGWTSHRDWIGYFNPIAGGYEKSDPMVFDAVRALDAEAARMGSAAPFVFLLDEMNLSPAEYYWAPFLRACDTYASEGCWVDLGGERSLHVPPHARFMATVNFDHTTEALSPRLLDRAWVLRLEPRDIDLDDAPALAVPDFSGLPAFSWERLVRAFGARGTVRDGAVRDTLKRVLDVLSSHGMPVSQRSQGMVRSYVAAATRYVDDDDPAARLAVLDRALAQKVLPCLAAPASARVEDMLERLAQECASLPISAGIVERMRETGADDGFYTYFA